MARFAERSWLLATPTPAAFSAFAAVSILAVPAGAIAPYGSFGLTVGALVLGIVITAAAGVVILLGATIARRLATRPRAHAFAVLTAFTTAGALRGWLYFALSPAFNVESSAGLPLRVANSTITTVFWMTICTIGFHSQSAYRRRLEDTLGQALLQRYSRISHSTLRAEFAGIEDALRSASGATGSLHQSEQMLRVADDVRAVVDTQVRPLSHRLWLQGNSLVPRLRVRALLADALRQLPYSPVRVTAFFAITTGVNLANASGIDSAIIRVTSATLAFFGCHLLLSRLARTYGVVSGVLYLSTVSVVTNFAQGYAAAAFGLPSGLPDSLVYAPYIAAVILLDCTATLAEADRRQLLEDLRRALGSDSDVDSDVDSTSVASYLHNSLQGELLAVATSLEAAANGTAEQQRRSVEQLGALLNRSISDDFSALATSPAARLSRAVEQWRGLLAINLHFDPNVIIGDSRAATLVQVIEESASNAVRHGGATRVDAWLDPSSDGLWTLTLENDGELSRSGNGLGSDWLRAHTLSSEITARPAGGVRCQFTL